MSQTAFNLLHRYQRKLTITLFFIVAFYLLAIYLTDQTKIIAVFSVFPLHGWLLILSCSLLSYLLRFMRWRIFARSLQHNLPNIRHFLYYLAGFSLTVTPAKSGETVRALFLADHGVPIKHTLAMFFTEHFLDLTVIILLASISILATGVTTGSMRILIVSLTVIILTALVFIKHPFFIGLLSRRVIAGAGSQTRSRFMLRLNKFLEHFIKLIHSAASLLSVKLMSFGLFVGLLVWLIQGFAFYSITELVLPSQTGISLSFVQALAAYTFGVLAGAASFIPGGVGSTELVMALILSLFGVDLPTAIAIALISRLSTVWFMMAVGLTAVAIISFLQRKQDNT